MTTTVVGESMQGTTLGNYEILTRLGAGGMGEVYLARHRLLGREVAIKLLPATVAQDRTRLHRLQREARLLAALDHPNVARLFGFEEAGGRHFLVMERVPGETLAQRLSRGPLSVREARALFAQLAEALDQAHERGIVHRDLKPQNLQVTPDGLLKVLDFGLAKESLAEREDDSDAPTRTESLTGHGKILGTVSYMSPEQARGRAVDKRTDIWSFGCCLYEALSGRRAFSGETQTDTLANILRGEPQWGALPRGVPDDIRALLERCLEKDVRRRQRDIGDVWNVLHSAPGSRLARVTWPRRTAFLLAAVALLTLLLVLFGVQRIQVSGTDGASTPPVARSPTPTTVPARVVKSRDGAVTIRVEVSDLLVTLDPDGELDELDELKVDDRALVFVVPSEPLEP